MQEIADLDTTLKESFCFFLFGKKGNSNRLELNVVA